MKKFTLLLILLAVQSNFGQNRDVVLTSKDSTVRSSWMFGLGYNFVDDSGDVFDDLFDFNNQWNTLPYPNRLTIGRYFKSGLGVEVIGTLNKYKEGKLIDKVINDSDKNYYAVDTRLSYDLNKLIGETAWFDPYVGVGFGYTEANNEGRSTYNAVIGFRTWFSDRLGLDFSSSGKWRTGNTGTNHIQHSAGVVYQFGIEKELSKKGKKKLVMLDALEKVKQRVNDSINAANEAKEAAALAEQLERKKEKARLVALEKAKLDEENQRKQNIENAVKELGHVYFDLNSSYLSESGKSTLKKLSEILKENRTLVIKVTSHTDSRGQSKYNMWLSQRRVQRTADYLIDLGVDESKVLIEAFGEENLLNECDDNTYCPEEKHKINRRSEFIVTKF